MQKQQDIANTPSCVQHPHLKSSYICINCQQHLLCQQCIRLLQIEQKKTKQKHKDHIIKSFQDFNISIQKYNQKINTSKNVKLLLRETKRIKDNFNSKITQIQLQIKSSQVVHLQYNKKQYQQLNGQINQLSQNINFKQFISQKKNAKSLEQLQKLTSQILMQNIMELRKIDTDLKALLDNYMLTLNQSQSKDKIFTFSNQNKHPALTVKDQIFLCKTDPSNNGHVHLGLFRQPFSTFNNKVNIRLNKIAEEKGIMLGACLLQVVKANDYYRCYKYGQGTYSIFLTQKKWIKLNNHSNQMLSNTYAFDTKNKQSLKSLNAWKQAGSLNRQGLLAKGDVITIQINYLQQKITFTRNYKPNAIIQMPIDLTKGSLYGFVGSSFSGDIFQIGYQN